MRIFTEKEAEDFLEKEGFPVTKRSYVKDEASVKDTAEEFGFPLVMKVSGKEIIHKNRLNGIILNINTSEEAVNSFRKLKEIKGFEAVMIQPQTKGQEFLLGIKKTPEFGHVLAFGAGGIHTEELKDISFRVYSINQNDAKEMIQEVKLASELKEEESDKIIKNLIKLNNLIEKYPDIKELDINPLMVNEDSAIIVDARIVWEN